MKQLAVSLVLVMITASLSGCMSDDSAQETLIEDEEIFRNESIDVIYENFQHPKYNQLGSGFLSNLSIIDLLFNEGDNSKQILLQSKDF